jgi:hypothetical protein
MEKVDKFLYIILENRNCSYGGVGGNVRAADFLQRTEDMLISFIQNEERSELEFPPLNSFYRRIVHCLGRRYNLVHRVEATNIFNSNSTLRKIYLAKPVGDQQKFQGPILKSSDWIAEIERENGIIETFCLKKLKNIRRKKKVTEEKSKPVTPKIKILKRETSTVETSDSSQFSSVATSPLLALEALTLEEKEAKYQAVRDRIFEGFTMEESEETCYQNFYDVPVIDSKTLHVKAAADALNPVSVILAPEISEPYVDAPNMSSSKPSCSTPLNPDAIPFSFTPVVEESTPEPVIEINHIYTIIPTSGQLTRDHFKEIIATYPTATIKTYAFPADFAFLLLNDNNRNIDDISLCNEKWIISKWIPEFYLD